MYRQETKSAFFLFVFLLFLSSCGTAQILGLRWQEAADMLRKGDMDFIVQAELPANFSQAVSELSTLSHIHPAAAYYAGRLAGVNSGSAGETRRLEMLLFSAALESPSPPARREATNRLLRIILETAEPQEVEEMLAFLSAATMRNRADALLLRAAALYRLERHDEAARLLPSPEDGWEKALAFFADLRASGGALSPSVDETTRQNIVTFLFGLPAGELRRWAYTEALAIEGLLTPGERGIIFSRRFPVSHRVTLNNLSPALQDGGLLFFHHPALIGDLARAYQFTPAMREEGLELFNAWNSLLETRTLPAFFRTMDEAGTNYRELQTFVEALDTDAINARRYLILHHSGRIERARGRLPASSEYFRRALAIAPDTLQSDACLWYILMNTVIHDPANAAPVFLSAIPQLTDMSVFNGAFDRLSRHLVNERQWDTMLEVFNALENKTAAGTRAGTSLAQFAWIIGRAVQENFLTTNRSAESFFRVALNEPSGSFYYRTMAALQLGENFSPVGNTRGRTAAAPVRQGGELEFLLGFFQYGATSLALPYIRAREADLSIPELRMVAGALASTGNWIESLRLIGRYMRRPDFQITREDLYLSHPRPYVEIVERYAVEMGLRPEMMFGLIRTESFFAADIVSHAGAVGLAQLMPATAQDIAGRVARAGGTDHRGPNGIKLTDPGVNVHLGSFYMRHLINNQMGGSTMLALMAYNGGQGRVRRWVAADRARDDGGLPKDLFLETIIYPETRNYGRLVLSAAAIYGYLYYGLTMEEVAASIFGQ